MMARSVKQNSIRIIAGAWRGRRVQFPDVQGLRPTPDRVRETLFNWLQHDTPGARCLDLFAGSGALGLEALSRGAREVVFIERSPIAAQNLREQLARLNSPAPTGVRGLARLIETNATAWLRSAAQPFDIVFLDPPFGEVELTPVMDALAYSGWLSPRALVYLECPRAAGVPPLPSGWELLKSKSAGEVGYHLARTSLRQPE